MTLTKEQCEIVLKEAHKGKEFPDCSVEDVNRVLETCKDSVKKAVELKLTTGKDYPEISEMLGYHGKYSYELYKTFIYKLQYAGHYNWYKTEEITKDTDILFVGFSSIAYNNLRRAGAKTVGDVCNMTLSDIRNIKGIGEITAKKIKSRLKELGFTLKK